MVLLRIIFFPVKLLLHLLGFTLKITYKTTTLPVRMSARTARWFGLKAFVLFVVGVAVGLLLAPVTGPELRARIRRFIEGSQPMSDSELADKIGFELSHAPRTWHLPQPEVAVVSGRVELVGSVPHETGREELERVAAAVPGVATVENRLVVEPEDGAESSNGGGTPA